MTTAPATASQSSFDFRPFGRMFWKEYRQQRTLWVGVLVFGMALQLIPRIVLAVVPVVPSDSEILIAIWIIPIYLASFFLIGSTAMLFALEREERTSDWLRNLSAPPVSILLAKYGFTVAATTAMTLVMALWAAVLSIGLKLETSGLFREFPSFGWAIVGLAAITFAVWGTILLFGSLGSLTSQRVVVAVPVGGCWGLAIVAVPMACVVYLSMHVYWFRHPHHTYQIADDIFRGIIACEYLTAIALNIRIGLRWCRGQYLDASWLEELNDRLTAMLPWNRGRSSRVPVAIESEHSGWRTWQRLVWQERHRESLHTGLLVIVCATSLLLALYSLADGDGAITFAVIPLIAALPLVMGVLGFRFDAGGQQLRFLANRGTSPTMIWLAKHVVWLPRACWIPAVCWAVACLVEWAFIPWSGSRFDNQYSPDAQRHPLVGITLFQREHFFDVLWFVLMSYAVGQAAAMLFRRMILAMGAGLMATILLIYWQVLVVNVALPRWWAVGGIAVWLLCLTGWYSRHWLIERRNWPVVKRLAVGLALPPMLLLFGAALYRWLEIPGLGPSSPTLMALLYPRETERREAIMGSDISRGLSSIRAAIKSVTEPTSPESRAVRDRLVSVNRSYQPLSQIRVSPELVTSLPSDASREQQDQVARERFWSFNQQALATIMEVLSNELPASYRTQRTTDLIEYLPPNTQPLLDAGRLSMEEDHPQQAFRYYMAGLRLARCFASQNGFQTWVAGRERQAEILQSLVEWSNHEDVTREMLLAAINQTRDELSRYPTLREASAAEFVLGFGSEKWMRQQLDYPDDSASLRFAKSVAVMLVPQETARMMRENEQRLYWRWHLYGSLEGTMQIPGLNALQFLAIQREQLTRVGEPGSEWRHAVFQSEYSSRFGKGLLDIVMASEVVNRQTLLALAMVLWKKDHDGALPSSLDELAVYCQIHGRDDPRRVLPVMALNDPWTGAMFHFLGMPRKTEELNEPDSLNPVFFVTSAGATPTGHANRAANTATDNGIATVGEYPGLSIQSYQGRLSLWFPPRPQR